MRTLILASITALLVACGDDTTAMTDGSIGSSSGDTTATATSPTSPTSTTASPSTSTSVGSESATDSGPDTTTGPSTDPGTTTDATISTSGDTSTSVDPSAGSSSSGEPGTSTGDTTGGVMGCGMEGPEIEASLEHVGEQAACGAIEFSGSNFADDAGPVYMLDGCPCGANCLKPDPWTFTLDVPQGWLPGKLPACPRIVVERQMGKQGCELIGVAIWDAQEPKNNPARYHAGSLLGPIAAAQGELKLEEIVAEECDCDFCCNVPTRFDLKFSALGDSTTIAEGGQGSLASNEFAYDIEVFQSHVSGLCDDSPHIDWAMKRS